MWAKIIDCFTEGSNYHMCLAHSTIRLSGLFIQGVRNHNALQFEIVREID